MFTNSKQPSHALMPPWCDTYRFLLRFLREVSSPSSQLHSGSAPLSWGEQKNSVCITVLVHAHGGTPSVTNQPYQCPLWYHSIHRAPSPPPQLPQWEKLLSPPA